jgi:hypothetical protein
MSRGPAKGGSVIEQISTADAVRLWGLKITYDGRYHVSLTHGTWRAIRHTDPLAVLTAYSGDDLAANIWADMERR